jgi:hypothetical protein
MRMKDFNPLEDRWWRAGAWLNWWDSTVDGYGDVPWVPSRRDALDTFARDKGRILHALGLVWSYRTVETGQLHALADELPAEAWRAPYPAMFRLGLADLGFPVQVSGVPRVGVRSAPFTALRLPVYTTDLRRALARLGCNPVEIASIGGDNRLRGRRQFDRHNLISTALAVAARRRGWLTCGEAWGSFAMLTGDPTRGAGGPDLQLVGSDMRVCVETTASGHQSLQGKIERWDRILALDSCRDVHVLWLDCARDSLMAQVEGLIAGHARMHAARASDFLDTFACSDGWEPTAGTPVEPVPWMRVTMRDIGSRLGLDAAGSYRLPPALRGMWLG